MLRRTISRRHERGDSGGPSETPPKNLESAACGPAWPWPRRSSVAETLRAGEAAGPGRPDAAVEPVVAEKATREEGGEPLELREPARRPHGEPERRPHRERGEQPELGAEAGEPTGGGAA